MYKKITTAAAAVLATGMLFSGAADAAPKEKPEKVQDEKEKENGKKDQEKENKGQLQQLKSVDKQLDKIEEKLLAYKVKMTELEEDEVEEPGEDDAIEPDEDGTDENDGTNESEEPAGDKENAQPEEPADELSKEPAPVSTLAETEEETVQDGEEVEAEEEIDEEVEEPAEEEELTDEEIEQETEEIEDDLEDNPGYAGKFHALQNRLSANSNRLDSLEAKGVDVTERRGRITVLQEDIKTVLASINVIQEKVKQEVEEDEDAVEKEKVKTEDAVKEWNVKFSKTLDEATLSELDIVVLDEAQNLVETTLSYDPEALSVAVTPGQPYQAGKTYTLYIGKNITGTDGKGLKNSVKMTFTVAVQ